MFGRRRLLAFGVLCVMVAALGSGVSRANHGADSLIWLEQAGNGDGGSGPIIANFSLRTVLFSNERFPLPSGIQRPGFSKYLAWGTVRNNNGSQLAMAMSHDGVHFDTPRAATLADPSGGTVPFLLNSDTADVVFISTSNDHPFEIFWKTTDLTDPGAPTTAAQLASVHRARSADGVHFETETPLVQMSSLPGSSAPPLLGSAIWNGYTYGPSDVIFQPAGATTDTCAAISPWNCRYVMLYDATGRDASSPWSKNFIGIAGSPDGIRWIGRPDPIMCPGSANPGVNCGPDWSPTGWDSQFLFHGKIRRVGAQFQMYFLGTINDVDTCGAYGPCWDMGIATSSNGLTWKKQNTTPILPRGLIQLYSPGDRMTLLFPQLVDDQSASGETHAKVYYARSAFNGTGPAATALARDTFLAYTAPAPGTGPDVRIGMPDNGFRATSQTPVEVYLRDTLGVNVGVDISTMTLKLDGAPIDGATWQRTLATAFLYPSWRVSVRGDLLVLPDGEHTFEATVRDLDGNLGKLSTKFVVDTVAPVTTLHTSPASPAIAFPTPMGVFTASTTDVGSGISRVRATFTNPLGQTKNFDSTSPLYFVLTKHSAKNWDWRFTAPNWDPFFAIPGEYTASMVGLDLTGRTEVANTANTVKILVL